MDATLDLKEKRQHGTELFPFIIYNPPLNDFSPVVCVHWHNEMEIVLFKQGSATYCIESDEYELRSGDIFIAQPGRIHSASTHPCSTSEIYAILCDIEALLGSATDLCTLNYITPLVNGNYQVPALIKADTALCQQLSDHIQQLVHLYYEKPEFYELRVKALLLEFIWLLFAGNAVVTDNPTRDMEGSNRIKPAIKYINGNYSKDIYLKSLAGEVGYSVNHFIRLFRTTTGMTPFAYLNRIRLLHAAELLMKSEKSVTEISLDIGYSNISYFQKKFKDFFGISPARYRKAHLDEVEHMSKNNLSIGSLHSEKPLG